MFLESVLYANLSLSNAVFSLSCCSFSQLAGLSGIASSFSLDVPSPSNFSFPSLFVNGVKHADSAGFLMLSPKFSSVDYLELLGIGSSRVMSRGESLCVCRLISSVGDSPVLGATFCSVFLSTVD